MTLDSTIKKFSENFGEALEEDYDPETFVAVSAKRTVGLVQLNKMHWLYSTFRRFSIQKIPKKEKKLKEYVKFGDLFFDINIIRKLLKAFFGNTFEVAIGERNERNVLIFKLGDYGIIIADMTEEYRELIHWKEKQYKWNNLFLEMTTQSDMIL